MYILDTPHDLAEAIRTEPTQRSPLCNADIGSDECVQAKLNH